MPPSRLTPDVFVGLIRQSKLVDEAVLKNALREMLSLAGVTKDPVKIAEELVNRKLLTRWQADKLLQGRNKGFFLGKYKLLSHLGRGGAGTVYLAEHSLMERRVAIKVLPRANSDQDTLLTRFRREAQALAALDHPNIVRANDIDQDGQVHFLVMEYVAGKSLQDLVDAGGPVAPVAAAEYTRQAAEGLHHAHKAGMVHRDVKPANLLLSDRGVVKVLDLGLARICDPGVANSVTHQGQQLGSVDYISPEQIRDPTSVDARGDLYSLGCTFYFLLVGHPPFNEGNDVNRLMAHQQSEPCPPSQLRPEIPPELERICLRLMRKAPEARFESARELTRHLVAWLSRAGGAEWAALNPAVGPTGQAGSTAGSVEVSPGDVSVSKLGLERSSGNAVAPTGNTSVGGATRKLAQPERSQLGATANLTKPAESVVAQAASGQAVAAELKPPRAEPQSPASDRPATMTKPAGSQSADTVAEAKPTTRVTPTEESSRPQSAAGVFAPVEDIHVSMDLSQLEPTNGGEEGKLRTFLNQLESPGAFPVGEAFAEPNLREGAEAWPPEGLPGRGPAATVIVPDGWDPGSDEGDGRRVLSERGFREEAEEELFEASAQLERSAAPVAPPQKTGPQKADPAKNGGGLETEARRNVAEVQSNLVAGVGTWQPPAEEGAVNRRSKTARLPQQEELPPWKRHRGWMIGVIAGVVVLALVGWWLSRSPVH